MTRAKQREGEVRRGRNSGHALSKAMQGLSPEQRIRVAAEVTTIKEVDSRLEGWSLYREPTTIDPPVVLRLLKRDGSGNLTQVINITERGN